MRNKVISVLFCLLLLSAVAVHLILPDKYYSENEKRTLKQLPKLSWESVRSGKFGTETESYLADQFPSRNTWVSIRTLLEKFSGKKESGGVYFAKDGYYIEIHRNLSGKQLTANLEAVKELQDALQEDGIRLRVMLVPTAADILSEKLPRFAPNADQQEVLREAETLGINVLDVTDALSAHRDEYIFYKTDHHWTSLGAYYAWAAWMKDLGRDADPLSGFQHEVLTDHFRGTTYSKVNDPFAAYDVIDAYFKTEKHEVSYNEGTYVADSIYERKYLEGSDQYAVFLNSNQADTVVKGDGEGRCLILKDSYANCFGQFVVDDFEETHLLDMRFFRGSVKKYVREHKITEVLVLYNIPNFAIDTGITRAGKSPEAA